jgi:hypothetical protein
MLKTLAVRYMSTVSKVAARHKAKIETPHGLRTCFEAKVAPTASGRWSPGSTGFPQARHLQLGLFHVLRPEVVISCTTLLSAASTPSPHDLHTVSTRPMFIEFECPY